MSVPKKIRIREMELTFFSYATEDQKKVIKSVQNIILNEASDYHLQQKQLKGYFGDPIWSYNIRIRNPEKAKKIFNNILHKLSTLDQFKLLEELSFRMDKSKNFYLRLSKQKAFLGKMMLSNKDPIRIKMKLQIKHRADPIETMNQYIKEKIL
jgi:RNA binding exosome subunit